MPVYVLKQLSEIQPEGGGKAIVAIDEGDTLSRREQDVFQREVAM